MTRKSEDGMTIAGNVPERQRVIRRPVDPANGGIIQRFRVGKSVFDNLEIMGHFCRFSQDD